MNQLAWFLATCPDADHRNGADAARHAERACELTETKNPQFLATLAAALAETGDFNQAVRAQTLAIDAAPASERPSYRKRLDLYKARQPFREEAGKSTRRGP